MPQVRLVDTSVAAYGNALGTSSSRRRVDYWRCARALACVPIIVQQKRLWAKMGRKWGNSFAVDGDRDQSLASKPGFDGVAPSAAPVAETGLIHGAQRTLRVGANPLENPMSLPAVPAEPWPLEVRLRR